MQMIAEGASRSNYSTMGAGGWIRRLNAITAAAFILTITLEQMQIGLIKSKSRGLKKTLIWRCSGRYICRKRLTHLHYSSLREKRFSRQRFEICGSFDWKIIPSVHFPLSHARLRKTAFGKTRSIKTAPFTACYDCLCLHSRHVIKP